jgi:hypothetical protein
MVDLLCFNYRHSSYSIVILSTGLRLSLTRPKATAKRQKQGSSTCHIHALNNIMGHQSIHSMQHNPRP